MVLYSSYIDYWEVPNLSRKHVKDRKLVAFGKATRRIRLDKNVSQEALADMAAVDRSYMGYVERGETNPTLLNIVKIAAALDMKVVDLIAAAKL